MRALFALFARSVREDCRARLPPILRGALVLIMLLVVWSSERNFGIQASPGRDLLLSVMALDLCFLGLAAVSIFPGAIAEEKEDGTLALLRMTKLNPLSILVGKAVPALLSALFLLAVQVPFALLAVTLGGVTIAQVLASFAVLGASAVFLCGLALFASVLCRTTLRAGFLTGAVAGLAYVGLPYLGFLLGHPGLRRAGTTSGQQFFQWVLDANPLYHLEVMLNAFTRTGLALDGLWINLGAGALLFACAWIGFDRFCAEAGERVRVARPAPSVPGRRRRPTSRAWPQALAWKDLHFMAGGRRGFLLRCGFALLILTAVYYYRSWENASYGAYLGLAPYAFSEFWTRYGQTVCRMACGAGALELLLQAARIFGLERREQTLSSLVCLPWTVGRLARQKIAGTLGGMVPWLGLLAFGWICTIGFGVREKSHSFSMSHFASNAYLVLQALLLLELIVLLSLRIRRGALPSAIAIILAWNMIFRICADALEDYRLEFLFIAVAATLLGVILMIVAVARRIEIAAAED